MRMSVKSRLVLLLVVVLTISQLVFGYHQIGDVQSSMNQVSLEKLPLVEMESTTDLEHQYSACRLVQIIHVLQHAGCQPKAISSFGCSGSCPSYVQMSTSKLWQHERSCSCCQQTGVREATFTLDCPALDPPYRQIKTQAPVDCMCRSCTDLGKENLQPQELVEAMATS